MLRKVYSKSLKIHLHVHERRTTLVVAESTLHCIQICSNYQTEHRGKHYVFRHVNNEERLSWLQLWRKWIVSIAESDLLKSQICTWLMKRLDKSGVIVWPTCECTFCSPGTPCQMRHFQSFWPASSVSDCDPQCAKRRENHHLEKCKDTHTYGERERWWRNKVGGENGSINLWRHRVDKLKDIKTV